MNQHLITTLKKHNQQHLINHYESLETKAKIQFESQLQGIDFELIHQLYRDLVATSVVEGDSKLSPLEPDVLATAQEKKLWYERGIEALKEGQVAVLLLAGGQGSRLGHEGPKGTFDIGLPSGASLFELQCQTLIALHKVCGVHLHWYVMTSETNNQETVEFFEAHDYFGYPKTHVTFFNQGMLPSVDEEGKLLIKAPGELSLSPDGNGGCFIALKKTGCLDQMKADGAKWLFVYGVDNAITQIADPYFVGYTLMSGLPAASKVVSKVSWDEKVGVLCYKNNRPAIVEYSEMPEDLLVATNNDGELLYNNANILNHLIRLDVLEAYLDQPIPYHLAHKNIPYMNQDGQLITPLKPNGYKFEAFIFDLFPYFDGMAALQVRREAEFAPVKNKAGQDSPESARNLYLALQNTKKK